jgi:tetratricopeptide (TPR) repeat protein
MLLGDLHDLNGAPRAAVRDYQRCLRLNPASSAAWRELGGMWEDMGEFKRARRALRRAQHCVPDDEDVAADIERVEWALFNPCPVLYDPDSVLWQANEALAAGRPNVALTLLGRRRKIPMRRARARIHATRGDLDGVLREWRAIAKASGAVQFGQADWYYLLHAPLSESAELWRLMLWQIRARLEGGTFHYPAALWELDVRTSKRFELYARFRLARAEGDLDTLLSLARRVPEWREPGELALALHTARQS